MSILINSPLFPDGTKKDLYIEDQILQHVGSVPEEKRNDAEHVIDGSDKLVSPPLMNGHSHAAMTLLRGWEDDLPLEEWLNEKIWPVEEKLTGEDVYWGTRLACVEMIKSGTTFFNDMYWEFNEICRAVEDSGIRASVSGVFIDHFNEETAQKQIEATKQNAEDIKNYSDRVQFALGPHSVYTVSEKSLEWAGEFSREHGIPMNIHLAETEKDVEQCKEQHGLTPVQYLDRLGALHEQTVIAHGIWVNDEDIQRIADRKARVVYNPIANLKLASGIHFPYAEYRNASVPVCLGTDGVASNNNHDLFEEIKTAALLQKQLQDDPEVLPAGEAVQLATEKPAAIFDVSTGVLKEDTVADLLLLDLRSPSLNPLHDVQSHLAYAASGGDVHTVICNGDILMENGTVPEEDQVRKKAVQTARNLFSK